jgi:formate/nitrite transporter FocA (FNT family)
MRRTLRARVLYSAAALGTLVIAVLWLGSVTYSCPDVVVSGGSACEDQANVEMLSRAIFSAILVGIAVYFIVRAVRAKPQR